MNINLDEIVLNSSSIAKFCGCSIRTITKHCEIGELNAYKKSENPGKWGISGNAFSEYLITHPSVFSYYKEMMLYGFNKELRDAILEKIGNRKSYTLTEFSDMFGVCNATIMNWIQRGYITSYRYEHKKSQYKLYFTEKSVKELLHNCPKTRKFYKEYIEKRKAS